MGSGVGVGRDTIRPMALTKTLEKWDTCRERWSPVCDASVEFLSSTWLLDSDGPGC